MAARQSTSRRASCVCLHEGRPLLLGYQNTLGRYLPTLVTRLSLSPPPTSFPCAACVRLTIGLRTRPGHSHIQPIHRTSSTTIGPDSPVWLHGTPRPRGTHPIPVLPLSLHQISARYWPVAQKPLPPAVESPLQQGKRGKGKTVLCGGKKKKKDTQHEEAVGDLESLLTSSSNSQPASLARPHSIALPPDARDTKHCTRDLPRHDLDSSARWLSVVSSPSSRLASQPSLGHAQHHMRLETARRLSVFDPLHTSLWPPRSWHSTANAGQTTRHAPSPRLGT